MREEDLAIVQGLVAVAWADGTFEQTEKDMLDALLDAFSASDAEKTMVKEYAKTKRTLAEIPLQDLSSADRRALLQHAVVMSFVDGTQSPEEKTFIIELAKALRIPETEATPMIAASEVRAKTHLNLL